MKVPSLPSLLLTITFAALMSCDTSSDQSNRSHTVSTSVSGAQINETDLELAGRDAQLVLLTRKVDSLQQLLQAGGKTPVAVSPRISTFVNRFLSTWEQVPGSKNHEAFLDFFLPNFFVNGVRLDTAAQIVNEDITNFTQRMKKLSREKELTYRFQRPQFLTSEIQNGLFTTSFKVSRTQMEAGSASSAIMVVTVTGRVQDRLRIGNFTWVEVIRVD